MKCGGSGSACAGAGLAGAGLVGDGLAGHGDGEVDDDACAGLAGAGLAGAGLACACAGHGDGEVPDMSVLYKMVCSMRKEIDSLKKTVAKYERQGHRKPKLNCDRERKNDLAETDKLLPIDVCFEDWGRMLVINRNDIYEIIRSGHIQGIINVIWNKIESVEKSPICIYNNNVMVYSKNGWKNINKYLLSNVTRNIQSQIPGVFERECPELSNIDAANFNFDAYMKNTEILLTPTPSDENFMKCIMNAD